MKTKILATAVIMLFAAGCATTAARRQFDDIPLPAGLVYQPQDSIVIESPTVKAAQLVYRGRLEPVTLGESMRTRVEASGWRPVSRTTTGQDGWRQVFEKDGNALEASEAKRMRLIVSRCVPLTICSIMRSDAVSSP